jgi:uncharacterized membrane protein
MSNVKLSIGDAIKTGWEVYKEKWAFMLGALVIVMLVSGITDALIAQTSGMMFASLKVLGFLLQTLVGMGLVYITLAVYDKKDVKYADWFNPVDKYLNYLFVTILVTLAVVGGLILFIVPGIIVAVALMFAPYLVIDKGFGPVEAIKKSWGMSKGYRGQLFLFVLAIIAINIVGAIAAIIGLLVTIPVTTFATVHIYRTILKANA